MSITKHFDNIYSFLHTKFTPLAIQGLATLGFFLVVKNSFQLLSSFYSKFIAGGHDLSRRYGKGSWAIITGPTAGLGSEYANQLAQLGFNIVLLGRNAEALEAKEQQLRTLVGQSIEIKIIEADFVESTEEGFFEYIQEELRHLDVSILVNNVGTAIGTPMHSSPDYAALELMKINTVTATLLTKRILPHFLLRRHRSAVINVSSVNSITAVKGYSYYNASKTFLDMLARTLQIQYQDKVDFLSVRHGTVATRMSLYAETADSLTVQDAVRGALSRLGSVNYTYGHWKHQIYCPLYVAPVIGPKVFEATVNTITKQIARKMQNSESV